MAGVYEVYKFILHDAYTDKIKRKKKHPDLRVLNP